MKRPAVAELRSISRTITELASARPDAPAVTCAGATLSWAELDRSSNRLARAYEALGVGHADMVTLALPNSVDFVVAAVAVWKLGATPQPVSHRLPARERNAIVELADSALVVGVEPGALRDRVCVPIDFQPDSALSDAMLDDRVAPVWKAPTSGGSTGRPKLILSAEPGVTGSARSRFLGTRPGTAQLIPGPMYHNGPFSVAMPGLFAGDHIVLLPHFDPESTLAAIEAHRVVSTLLVPTMMHRIWRLPQAQRERYDLSSLEHVFHLAAPCPEWLKEAWIGWLGPERIVEIYAATEGHAATRIRGDEWLLHRGSVGRCAMGEITIFDPDTGRELAPGTVGEVVYRSETPTYRYIGAEPTRFDGGWEGLGDMGWMDAEGYLYLCDRRIDMILCGGANIYPAEVEAAILEHPSVESCAVIGLVHEDLGHTVHAIVQAPPATDLHDFLAERISPVKIPRSFEFVTEPVRDDAGKVRRRQLQEERSHLQGDSP